VSAVNIHLPESLHKQVQKLAEEEGVTVESFVTLAVAEKMAAIRTVEHLHERAAKGNRDRFEAILSKVPDVEPEEHDRL
jgi:flagellar motor switch protein FliM